MNDLYHEVRGAGPVLLMIPGGNGDAATYGQVAGPLAARYTVVTYDRHGFSRSRLDEPPTEGLRVADDVEDAVHLIEQLGDGPAHVFGSSSGAIVALDLLARHPDRVRAVVAHEPPAIRLLPDADRQLAALDGVYDTYRRDGVDAAMRLFSDVVGMPGTQPPADVELPPPVREMLARIRGNQGFWLEHELRQYTRVVPDLTALAAVAGQLVPAVGHDSAALLPGRPSAVLAERLGLPIAEFPGGHIGYVTHPAEFAGRLLGVLGAR
jgi:pimeloyl-ACP methyl ester carboxylesterase